MEIKIHKMKSWYWKPLVLANLRNSAARCDKSGYANLLHVRWLCFDVLLDWGSFVSRRGRDAA